MDTTRTPVAVIRAQDGAILVVLQGGRVLRVERNGGVLGQGLDEVVGTRNCPGSKSSWH